MSPVIESLVVAFLAGTLASVAAGYINRGIARIKRIRKQRRSDTFPGEASS